MIENFLCQINLLFIQETDEVANHQALIIIVIHITEGLRLWHMSGAKVLLRA